MLIAGIDEAGRGCVIGPLIITGILLESESLPKLIELGVKDSKLLTSKKRDSLYSEILKLSINHYTINLPPPQIDKVVRSDRKLHKLNRLEAQTMAKIIEVLKPQEAYVDAADVLENRFGSHIQECLRKRVKIFSEHKADRTYPIVSAASIIAKVERDREIVKLTKRYGDFGSGYLIDEKTVTFLKKLLDRYGEYPSCVRKSWEPAIRVRNGHRSVQEKLC